MILSRLPLNYAGKDLNALLPSVLSAVENFHSDYDNLLYEILSFQIAEV